VSTARILARGRLLTVAGPGHTSLFLSSCADRHVSRYLLPPTLTRGSADGQSLTGTASSFAMSA
jgi:hypothetical protein